MRITMVTDGRLSRTLSHVAAWTLLVVFSPATLAEEWPTFRGAGRTAISSETGLLQQWPEDGPKLVWSASGAGRGYASPAIADGKVYTLGDAPSTATDENEYLSCFDLSTGKQIWKTMTGEPWNRHRAESWNGSRATPTVDGDRVYVITPFGVLLCAATKDGSVIWKKDLKEGLSGKKKDSWGYSEAPLIDGEKLICTPGGEVNTVVALNKNNGELIWSCAREGDVGAGHSCVVVSMVNGRKVYVQNTGGGPMGIDPETGELLWDYEMSPPTAFIPTPIVKGNYVYSVAGYGLGAALLEQVPEGSGVSVKEIYGPKPELANKHGGVVEVDGKVYGGLEDRNVVVCADMMTGEVIWKERGSGSRSAAVAAADGKLYVRYQDGMMTLVDLTPAGFSEISAFKTPNSGEGDKPSWAHPVISGGKLYLRENDSILCYDITK
jgi:outer membrane protein assembly factor BamB